MKSVPTISKYMTTCPHSIGSDQTVRRATERMEEHRIRHLPVLDGGHLVGMVTDRDLKLYAGLGGTDPEKDTVRDVVDTEVYAVKPNALLDEVVTHMAEKRLGSAVVVDNDKVVGIFTSVDAMRALGELLHTRLK